jgi:hypothetical protein
VSPSISSSPAIEIVTIAGASVYSRQPKAFSLLALCPPLSALSYSPANSEELNSVPDLRESDPQLFGNLEEALGCQPSAVSQMRRAAPTFNPVGCATPARIADVCLDSLPRAPCSVLSMSIFDVGFSPREPT